MAENSTLDEFKQGIKLLRNGKSAEALEYLQHAAEVEPTKTRTTFPFWVCPLPALNESGCGSETLRDGPELETRRRAALLELSGGSTYPLDGVTMQLRYLIEA